MSLIATILTEKYIPNWGIRHAIREIKSNAIDGELTPCQDEGELLPKSCHTGYKGCLTITNEESRYLFDALPSGIRSRGRQDT